MRKTRFAMLLVSAMSIGACSDPSGLDPTLAPSVPLAYTRFVNAVADTGASDWRFIDQLEYSPIALGLTFRNFSPYQGTAPGARKLRIFPTSTDINVTQQFFVDTTITFAASTYYTIVHLGYARTGQSPADGILVLVDTIPTVAATSIAVRTLHLGLSLANQDVFASPTAGALPATPLVANLAYRGTSGYLTQTPGALVLRTTNTGTTTVNATATAPAGAAADATNNLTAIGGSTIGGSAFTGFYFPRSVALSSAPQTTAFTAPAIVYLVDRHPK